jgi:hypothetical protein
MGNRPIARWLVRARRIWRDLFFRGAALLALTFAALVFGVMGHNPQYTKIDDTKECTEYYGNEAERRVATYTFWLDILTAILAVSTFGLWVVTVNGIRNQKRETARSLALTRELFVTERRPWIKVEVAVPPIKGSIYRADGWISIKLVISLQNVGESPALMVIRGWVFMFPTKGRETNTFQEFMDSIRSEIDARMRHTGRLVFPKEIVTIDCDLDISPWQIECSKTFKGGNLSQFALNTILN